MQRRDHALSLVIFYKAWPAALVLSVSSFYLSTWSLLFCLSSRSTPSLLSAKQSCTLLFSCLPFFSFILNLPALFTAPELLPVPLAMSKKKSAENFFQRARAKGSGINKKIVNEAEVQKHLADKTQKNYARALNL